LLNNLEKENELPVFYLIDEIFKGTNNVERLIGSKNLILYLSSKNGVGVISTHDLELIKLADDSIKILNYHFREEIRDNKMYFDYKLKQGGSPTTNALKIMILGGLPINE
ncbi:MAG: MutS-related protein, partial [Syntrophothermus sp.]